MYSVDEYLQIIQTGDLDNTKILIIVSNKHPSTDYILIENNMFALRVVYVLKSTDRSTNANMLYAIWYMRYKNGYNSWWKQEQKDHVCTQCENDIYISQALNWNTDDDFFPQNLYLYVRVDDS